MSNRAPGLLTALVTASALAVAPRAALAGTFLNCIDKAGESHLYDSSKGRPAECQGGSGRAATSTEPSSAAPTGREPSDRPASVPGTRPPVPTPAPPRMAPAPATAGNLAAFEVEVRSACEGEVQTAHAHYVAATRKESDTPATETAAHGEAVKEVTETLQALRTAQSHCSSAVTSAAASGVPGDTLKTWGAP